MFSDHFYHGTLKKMVTVFGALFNNIYVVRKDISGNVVNQTRVPIAYGPKQKFLARIDEQKDADGNKVAIKLPRMSFEIIGMTYDPTMKVNRNNTISVVNPEDPTNRTTVRTFSPFRINFQLSVMSKNQDDCLQIIEQILPYFQPDYTMTIKDVEGMDISNDVPVVLLNMTMSEDYEGDFVRRRAIIYTLDFELRVRFYGPTEGRATIQSVTTNFINEDTSVPLEALKISLDPLNATPGSSYTITETIKFFTDTDQFQLTMLTGGTGAFAEGESITGSNSGTTAQVFSWDAAARILLVSSASGAFYVGDTVTGATSGAAFIVGVVTPTYT